MEEHSDPAFGPQWWEQHYQDHAPGHDAPNPQLVVEVTGLTAGTALDAGCGRGADALWLARHGWQVTAVDVSPTAVRAARETAAHRNISWEVADVTTWQAPQQYDLVVSQYVHPAVPFGDFVSRLAGAVAPGGTLLLVGHDHGDEHSKAHAPQQASITIDAVTGVLSAQTWQVEVAEARSRRAGTGHTAKRIEDVVVKARHMPA